MSCLTAEREQGMMVPGTKWQKIVQPNEVQELYHSAAGGPLLPSRDHSSSSNEDKRQPSELVAAPGTIDDWLKSLPEDTMHAVLRARTAIQKQTEGRMGAPSQDGSLSHKSSGSAHVISPLGIGLLPATGVSAYVELLHQDNKKQAGASWWRSKKDPPPVKQDTFQEVITDPSKVRPTGGAVRFAPPPPPVAPAAASHIANERPMTPLQRMLAPLRRAPLASGPAPSTAPSSVTGRVLSDSSQIDASPRRGMFRPRPARAKTLPERPTPPATGDAPAEAPRRWGRRGLPDESPQMTEEGMSDKPVTMNDLPEDERSSPNRRRTFWPFGRPLTAGDPVAGQRGTSQDAHSHELHKGLVPSQAVEDLPARASVDSSAQGVAGARPPPPPARTALPGPHRRSSDLGPAETPRQPVDSRPTTSGSPVKRFLGLNLGGGRSTTPAAASATASGEGSSEASAFRPPGRRGGRQPSPPRQRSGPADEKTPYGFAGLFGRRASNAAGSHGRGGHGQADILTIHHDADDDSADEEDIDQELQALAAKRAARGGKVLEAGAGSSADHAVHAEHAVHAGQAEHAVHAMHAEQDE